MNTPNPPLYSGCNPPHNVPDSGHHGLWYERFFNQYDGQRPVYGEDKLQWIKTVEGNVGDTDTLLQAAIDRLATLCKGNLHGECDVFTAPWHFVTGLGNPHPVENGFLWHLTLGAPYIPGAAVKGLVRAWVEAWMDFNDDAVRASTLRRWFGSEDKDPKVCKPDSEAGAFIFFDALPIKRVKLKADIMTPHMGDWYEKGGEGPKEDGSNVPADWHSPVPVPFLVADKPTFMFAVAPRNGDANVELADVMGALASALESLGVGAKTAVGYGHLSEDRDAKKAIGRRIERAAMPEEQRLVAEIREKEERIRAEVKEIKQNDLAKMFSKDFNKTRKVKSDSWKDFVEIVWEVHGEMIRSWKDSLDANKQKAYKKLCNERGQP